jgi:hypothetical protein
MIVESMIVSAIRARHDGVIHAAGQRRGPVSCPDAAAAKLDAEEGDLHRRSPRRLSRPSQSFVSIFRS